LFEREWIFENPWIGPYPNTGVCWHQRKSPEFLAFNLGQQFLDVINIAAGSETHWVGFSLVATSFRRLFHLVQASAKRFIDNRFKWFAHIGRNGPRNMVGHFYID
jgi:hypothetical protein